MLVGAVEEAVVMGDWLLKVYGGIVPASDEIPSTH